MAETNTLYNKLLVPQLVSRGLGLPYSLSLDSTALAPLPAQDRMYPFGIIEISALYDLTRPLCKVER